MQKEAKHPAITSKRTFGQKSADLVTRAIGSWAFITVFIIFMILWIILNSLWLFSGFAWDHKPFIMLNLILSCIAAIQAPIILMSQNRQSEKERIRAEYDYKVDKKAEKEIEEIQKQLDRIEKRLR